MLPKPHERPVVNLVEMCVNLRKLYWVCQADIREPVCSYMPISRLKHVNLNQNYAMLTRKHIYAGLCVLLLADLLLCKAGICAVPLSYLSRQHNERQLCPFVVSPSISFALYRPHGNCRRCQVLKVDYLPLVNIHALCLISFFISQFFVYDEHLFYSWVVLLFSWGWNFSQGTVCGLHLRQWLLGR
jgi:hypothetical protein